MCKSYGFRFGWSSWLCTWHTIGPHTHTHQVNSRNPGERSFNVAFKDTYAGFLTVVLGLRRERRYSSCCWSPDHDFDSLFSREWNLFKRRKHAPSCNGQSIIQCLWLPQANVWEETRQSHIHHTHHNSTYLHMYEVFLAYVSFAWNLMDTLHKLQMYIFECDGKKKVVWSHNIHNLQHILGIWSGMELIVIEDQSK